MPEQIIARKDDLLVEFLDETIPGEHDAGEPYYLGEPVTRSHMRQRASN